MVQLNYVVCKNLADLFVWCYGVSHKDILIKSFAIKDICHKDTSHYNKVYWSFGHILYKITAIPRGTHDAQDRTIV